MSGTAKGRNTYAVPTIGRYLAVERVAYRPDHETGTVRHRVRPLSDVPFTSAEEAAEVVAKLGRGFVKAI